MTVTDQVREQAVARAIDACRDVPGALLPVLHMIQDELGFVPPAAVESIALGLNLSRADVHGVLSFYHDFRTEPVGQHVLRLCRAEACQAMGGAALEDHLRRRLNIGFHDTTADGAVTLEPAYCLGLCACAPSLMIDGQVHGRLDIARVDALLAGLCSGPFARPDSSSRP